MVRTRVRRLVSPSSDVLLSLVRRHGLNHAVTLVVPFFPSGRRKDAADDVASGSAADSGAEGLKVFVESSLQLSRTDEHFDELYRYASFQGGSLADALLSDWILEGSRSRQAAASGSRKEMVLEERGGASASVLAFSCPVASGSGERTELISRGSAAACLMGGMVTLRLSRQAYTSTGLSGRPSRIAVHAREPSKQKQAYVVEQRVDSKGFRRGKKTLEHWRTCLGQFPLAKGWVCGGPASMWDSPRGSHWAIRHVKTGCTLLQNLRLPTVEFLFTGVAKNDHNGHSAANGQELIDITSNDLLLDGLESFLDWCGLVGLAGCADSSADACGVAYGASSLSAITSTRSSHPFVFSYDVFEDDHLSACAEDGGAVVASACGMVSVDTIERWIETAEACLLREGVRFVVLSIAGFETAPVSWAPHEHGGERTGGGENDLVLVISSDGVLEIAFISDDDTFS